MALVKNDFSHCWLRIREIGRLWKNLRTVTSDTLQADQNYPAAETIITNDGCLFDPDVEQGEKIGILGQRALVAGVLSNPRQLLDPVMLQLSRAIGYPQTDPLAVLPLLYSYMASPPTGVTFKSNPKLAQRGFTRNAWTAAGSNVGNGTVVRLNVDQYGNPLEADAPDVLTFKCVADSNSGTNPGQEQFSVTGQPFRDTLARYTSGYSIGIGNQIQVGNLVGVTGDATKALISNPSFSDFSGTGASSTFALTGWTQTSGLAASMSVSTLTADLYRSCAIETTPGALKVTASITLTQTIPAGQLKAFLAYMAQVAVNFTKYSGTGSVSLQIGNLGPFTVNSGGPAGYNLLQPTIGKGLYYANFATSGSVTATLTITVSGGTAILVDDILFQPFQNIGGKLLWAAGGSTNWVVNDYATITDTVPTSNGLPTSGFTQTLLAEAYGTSLPALAFASQGSGPLLAGTGGGTTAKGQYGVVVTFYNGSTLVESLPTFDQNIVLDGTTNNRISLTSIPIGPGGTTARYIYVTQANDFNTPNAFNPNNGGPESAYYFCAAINDNATTVLTIDPATANLSIPLSVLADI